MAFANYGQKFGPQPDQDSLLEEDFAPHFQAWKKDPTPENSTNILRVIDPVIQSAMRTYAGQGSPSPTLRTKAKLIALDSLKRYDASKAKLRTHLMTNLQGLHRAAAEEGQIVSVPERVRLDNIKLHAASMELEDRLGRPPSDAELSRHTGLSTRRLAHIRQAQPPLIEGSLETFPNESGEIEVAQPAVVSRGNGDTWVDYVHMDLEPTDQFIMESILGLYGKPILAKGTIAKKLGLSAGAVSQRAAKIQRLLDKRYDLGTNLFQ